MSEKNNNLNEEKTAEGNVSMKNEKITAGGNVSMKNEKKTAEGNVSMENVEKNTIENVSTENEEKTAEGNVSMKNEKKTAEGNVSTENEEKTAKGNVSMKNEKKTEEENVSMKNEKKTADKISVMENEINERKLESHEKPNEGEIKDLLSKIIEIIKNEIRKENSVKDDIHNELKKKGEENKELKQKLNTAENEVEKQKKNFEKERKEKDDIHNELKKKGEENKELKQKLNTAEQEVESQKSNLKDDNELNINEENYLISKKNGLNEELTKLNQEIENLKSEKEQIISNLLDIKTKIKNDIQDLQLKVEDLTKNIEFKVRAKAESKNGIEFSKYNMVNSENEKNELSETIITRDLEKNDQIEFCCEKISLELSEFKNSLTERLSRLDKKLDEKSLLDDFMSQNDRCDRQSMFETLLKEINDLKHFIRVIESSSEIPQSVARNTIALRLDSLIPIYDESLLQNLDPEAFKFYHTPEWLCLAFFDLLKKKILSLCAINEAMEILIKIIRVCDEKNLDFIEKILNEVDNYNLVAKYETVRQVMMRDPNRKRRMMNIFIDDLEKLVKSTTTEKFDQNFQQNNPELYQKIKIILEMANYSVYGMIGNETINTLKIRWNCPRSITRQSVLLNQ